MRRTVFLALVVVLAVAGVARAVTKSEPDNGAHPYVGLVGFYDASGTYVQRCSGTLLTPTVFLTAAHCTFADDGTLLADAQVWFDDVVGPGVVSSRTGGTRGTAIPNPGFTGFDALPDTNDVAVVQLSSPVTGVGFGTLPTVGALDELKRRDTWFTLVGYGYVQVKPTEVTGDRTRRKATAKMGALNGKKTAGFNLKTKPGKAGGTFCFGDSGGPVLLDETNLVVAINSLVKENCKGAALSFRVDTTAAQAFLAPFLAVG